MTLELLVSPFSNILIPVLSLSLLAFWESTSMYQHVAPKWSLWPLWSSLSWRFLQADPYGSFTKYLSCWGLMFHRSVSQKVVIQYSIDEVWAILCNSFHVLSPCSTHFSSQTKWIYLDWIYKVSMCSYSHFPKLKNLKHRCYHRRGLETSKRIGLPFSLLSHSSSLLPLLTHNSYCISCCCSLLVFSFTPAAKPGLSWCSHSCTEGSVTACLSLCSDTASKVQALQEPVEPYRKEQVFHLVFLSKSKGRTNAYEEEVRSCLVTCYTNWRLVVPVGKRKLKKLSAAWSPQNSCSKALSWANTPLTVWRLCFQINPKWQTPGAAGTPHHGQGS